MALNGRFLLNGADIAPLTFPGVGTFMAFSGNGAYKNRDDVVNIRERKLGTDLFPKEITGL